jgi:hypothetical protein
MDLIKAHQSPEFARTTLYVTLFRTLRAYALERQAAVRRPHQAGSHQRLLNHQRVHVHETHLKQVQRQHQYLLILPPVAGELSTL